MPLNLGVKVVCVVMTTQVERVGCCPQSAIRKALGKVLKV